MIAGFVCALFLVAGCSVLGSQRSTLPVSRTGMSSSEPSTSAEQPGDTNVFLAQVPAGALGPRLAFSSHGTVVVWADTSGEEPSLYSMAMGPDGVPFPSRRSARVDATARQLTVGWTNKGEVLVSTVHKKAGQEVLTATRLTAEGVFEAGPQVLATTPNAILFTRVVPTALGAVVVWVERAAGAADLYSIVIDEKGPRRATRQARGISAWQVVARGGAIAVVTREGADAPSLMFRHLGDRGDTIGAPIELARNVAGGMDVDLAVNRSHILVAWSEAGAYHSELRGALLDASGNVIRASFPLTAPRGDQVLLSVQGAEESEHFHVAWREPLEAHHGRPSVFMGQLTIESPSVVPRYSLNAARRDALLPIFFAKGEALAILTDVSCESGMPGCAESLERASLLLPGEDAAPRGATLRVNSRRPTMAWDLSCARDRCLYLLSDGSDPARVHLATVDAKTPVGESILQPTSEEGPQIVSHETLTELPELAELHGVGWDGGARSLLAWVSYFQPDLPYVIPKEPAADGRRAPLRARLTTVDPASRVDGGGGETIISYRARSLGGVHLIAPEDNRGLLLWSALDQQKPQLFATLVDASGKKIGQRMLTKTDGEVTDIAGVRVDGGYLLSWVDGTGASPRVLALRVSDTLIPVGSPRIVAERAVSPSGVTLLAKSEGVLCVWSDARDAGLLDTAQIYGTFLEPATGSPKNVERQLTVGPKSAHSPLLASGGTGESVLAWISQSSDDVASLHVGILEKDGMLSKERAHFSKDGDVRDFSLECSYGAACNAAVIVAQGEENQEPRISLWALAGVSPDPKGMRENLVVPLWTPTAVGVSPVLLGDQVYYSDRAEDGSGWRLRRATINFESP